MLRRVWYVYAAPEISSFVMFASAEVILRASISSENNGEIEIQCNKASEEKPLRDSLPMGKKAPRYFKLVSKTLISVNKVLMTVSGI